jgi:hypothetical protein
MLRRQINPHTALTTSKRTLPPSPGQIDSDEMTAASDLRSKNTTTASYANEFGRTAPSTSKARSRNGSCSPLEKLSAAAHQLLEFPNSAEHLLDVAKSCDVIENRKAVHHLPTRPISPYRQPNESGRLRRTSSNRRGMRIHGRTHRWYQALQSKRARSAIWFLKEERSRSVSSVHDFMNKINENGGKAVRG